MFCPAKSIGAMRVCSLLLVQSPQSLPQRFWFCLPWRFLHRRLVSAGQGVCHAGGIDQDGLFTVKVGQPCLESGQARLVIRHDVRLCRVALKVVLMFGFGGIKGREGADLGHDLAGQNPGRIQLRDVALKLLLLRGAFVKSCRAVLRAYIGMLAVQLGRVMGDRKKICSSWA